MGYISAPVNKIIPFSLVDGPGSRTVVFLEGCNLGCAYCHNPETQQMCVSCGVCVEVCPAHALSFTDGKVAWDKGVCVGCDACIKVCPNFSSPKVEVLDAHEVYERVVCHMPFIRGITVSGGECMLRVEFLEELFMLTHTAGLTNLIDSNGTIDFKTFPQFVKLCDGVMIDVKAWGEGIFDKICRGSNKVVKNNLRYLASMDKIEEIRLVVVQGKTDTEESIHGISDMLPPDFVATVRLKLIKFCNIGVKGWLRGNPSPTDEYMGRMAEVAKDCGFSNIVIQ